MSLAQLKVFRYKNGACPAGNRNAPLTLTRMEVLEMADQEISRPVVIYKITHVASGRAYIGLTERTERRRWNEHIAQSMSKKRHALHNAIRKYGAFAFVMEILYEATSVREAVAVERAMIAQYGTMRPNGYNLTVGGEAWSGSLRSAETRQKISNARSGTKLSDEHKRKISDGGRGRVVSEETRQKQSAAKLGWKMPDAGKDKLSAYRTGMKWSDESRAKASASKKGIPWTAEKRAAMAIVQATPEYRAKMRAASAKRGKQPPLTEAQRQVHVEIAKKIMSDPARRAALSAKAIAQYADPEFRARFEAGMVRREENRRKLK